MLQSLTFAAPDSTAKARRLQKQARTRERIHADPAELQQLIRLYPVLGQLSPAARTAVQTDAQRFAFPPGAHPVRDGEPLYLLIP